MTRRHLTVAEVIEQLSQYPGYWLVDATAVELRTAAPSTGIDTPTVEVRP